MPSSEMVKVFTSTEGTVEIIGPANARTAARDVEDNFGFLKIYLWLHGIGFTNPVAATFQNLLGFCLSVTLAVLFNAFALCEIFRDFYDAEKLNKDLVAETTANMSGIAQRVLLYHRIREIRSIVKRLAALYSSLAPDRKLNFKLKSAVVLMCCDTIFILIFIGRYNSYLSRSKKHYAFIPPPHAWIVDFMRFVIMGWGDSNASIAAYFYCLCCVLKATTTELQRELESQAHCNVDRLFNIYNGMTDIISLMNETFGHLFMFGFIILSVSMFIDFSNVLLHGLDNITGITVLVQMIFDFSWFVVICLSSSTVAAAVCHLRNTVHKLPLDTTSTCFKLKVMENFSGFTVLDSITLNKALILSALGALTTYSVIVVTFEASTG